MKDEIEIKEVKQAPLLDRHKQAKKNSPAPTAKPVNLGQPSRPKPKPPLAVGEFFSTDGKVFRVVSCTVRGLLTAQLVEKDEVKRLLRKLGG